MTYPQGGVIATATRGITFWQGTRKRLDKAQRNWLNVDSRMDADILNNDTVLAEIVRRLVKAYEP